MDGLVTEEILARVWRVEGRETPEHSHLHFLGQTLMAAIFFMPLCDPRFRQRPHSKSDSIRDDPRSWAVVKTSPSLAFPSWGAGGFPL